MAYPSTASTVHLSSKIKLPLVDVRVITVMTMGELFCHNTFIFSFLSSTFWHYMIAAEKERDSSKNIRPPFSPFQEFKFKFVILHCLQKSQGCHTDTQQGCPDGVVCRKMWVWILKFFFHFRDVCRKLLVRYLCLSISASIYM